MLYSIAVFCFDLRCFGVGLGVKTPFKCASWLRYAPGMIRKAHLMV
jgi:hypothetical protein